MQLRAAPMCHRQTQPSAAARLPPAVWAGITPPPACCLALGAIGPKGVGSVEWREAFPRAVCLKVGVTVSPSAGDRQTWRAGARQWPSDLPTPPVAFLVPAGPSTDGKSATESQQRPCRTRQLSASAAPVAQGCSSSARELGTNGGHSQRYSVTPRKLSVMLVSGS